MEVKNSSILNGKPIYFIYTRHLILLVRSEGSGLEGTGGRGLEGGHGLVGSESSGGLDGLDSLGVHGVAIVISGLRTDVSQRTDNVLGDLGHVRSGRLVTVLVSGVGELNRDS